MVAVTFSVPSGAGKVSLCHNDISDHPNYLYISGC